MSTVCFGCATGVGTIPSGSLPKGDVLGCCRICHALFCGKHGHRNRRVPQFECVLCIPALAGQSAAALSEPAGEPGDPSERIRAELRAIGESPPPRGLPFSRPERRARPPYFSSVEELLEAHPVLREVVSDMLNARWAPDDRAGDAPAMRVVRSMPDEARRLLGIGQVFAERLEVLPHLPPVLLRLFAVLEREPT